MRSLLLSLAASTVAVLAPLAHSQNGSAAETVPSSTGDLDIEELASLEYPWGLALLPDGRLLITEKPGRLRLWEEGSLSEPIQGLPEIVYRGNGEQGGLLDVEIDPDFANNQLIYVSYVEGADQQPAALGETGDARFGGYLDMDDDVVRGGAVARGRLDGNQLRDVEVIWRQVPKTVGRGHFGNRILFAEDGTLFITSGERMRFDPAQDLNSNLGKVVRINTDGSIPEDNPHVDEENARGDIWSSGHRNILAAAFDPSSDQFWAFEMGPLGGDEVNLVEAGKNYGWPRVSDGSHYARQTIPPHPGADQFQAPVRTWTPVVSPSGAIFYQGSLFADWEGSVLVGGLTSQALVRLVLDGKKVALQEHIDMQRRIRDVIEAPDGSLFLIEDEAEGGLLRVTPTQKQAGR